jgi:hypothetical protein
MAEQETGLDVLVVEVGHEELEHGRVRAELHADGRLDVQKVFEGKAEHYEGRVEKGAAEETLERADDLARIAPREGGGYRPVPDEARYHVELRRPGEEPVAVDVWQGELEESEAARKLIRSLAEQVQRASDGRALL